MKIFNVSAREILDSRGNPTVAATVELEDGTVAEASVPSGASTGKNEAVELRDEQKDRFFGLGVLSAIQNINNIIAPAFRGHDAKNQEELDNLLLELDGTPNKEHLGANAMLACSIAVSKAEAISENKELFEYLAELFGTKKLTIPTPMFNILNGGKHAENNLDIQETMVVPVGLVSFEKKLRAGSEVYHTLKNTLLNRGLSVALGDEGGFAPALSKNEEAIEIVNKAITDSGYNTEKIRVSIDFAATEFYQNGEYHLKCESKSLSPGLLISKLAGWVKKYNLLSIEDGLSEEDASWKELTEKIKPALSVGDDLFTTNPEKIALGSKVKLASGVIIKPNQIGTLTETLSAVREAKSGGLKVIVSHRSGETEDSFIADLAVGVGADYIKSGAPARSERLAKYNRLSKIEDILKSN